MVKVKGENETFLVSRSDIQIFETLEEGSDLFIKLRVGLGTKF